jgi:hypothetical protein
LADRFRIRAIRTEEAEIGEERKRLKARKRELRQNAKDLTERRDKEIKQYVSSSQLDIFLI